MSQLRSSLPSAGKDIITRLLDKREWTRLGSKSGASEVKQHKWFAKINWGLLRNTQPPVSFPILLCSARRIGRMCAHTRSPCGSVGAHMCLIGLGDAPSALCGRRAFWDKMLRDAGLAGLRGNWEERLIALWSSAGSPRARGLGWACRRSTI